jgi:hypothetical protein
MEESTQKQKFPDRILAEKNTPAEKKEKVFISLHAKF